MASVALNLITLPRGAVAYPDPEIKWAKHAKKKCLGCRAPLQGRYYALDRWTWCCMACGTEVLQSGGVLS
jgi:hypothetical protein